jgi:hypothetical protein
MCDLFTITDKCYLLDSIEKYLKDLPLTDEPKLYFLGGFDLGVDHLKPAVLVRNKTVTLVLLRFLTIIIDNKPEFLVEDSFHSFVQECDYNNDLITVTLIIRKEIEMEEIIRNISKKEENNMLCFPLDEPICRKFDGISGDCVESKSNFDKHLNEIDIWSLPRIMKEMRKLY